MFESMFIIFLIICAVVFVIGCIIFTSGAMAGYEQGKKNGLAIICLSLFLLAGVLLAA